MIVVNKGSSDATFIAANPYLCGYVHKFVAVFVVKQSHTADLAHGQVGEAIVIKITSGAAKACAYGSQAGFLRHVLKFAITEIAQQAALPFSGGKEKQIGPAVAVEVEETDAPAGADGCGGAGGGELRNGGGRGMHGNLGRSTSVGSVTKFSQGEFPLVAVACTERRTQMLGGEFLEMPHALAGGLGFAFSLVGAGEAELRPGGIGSGGQYLLEGRDGLLVFLEL